MLRLLLSVTLVANLAACTSLGDSRDAAWDPRGSHSLLDQIPPEESAAGRRCCGHLRSCEQYQTPRC